MVLQFISVVIFETPGSSLLVVKSVGIFGERPVAVVDEEEATRMGLSAIGCAPSGESVSCHEGAAKNRHRGEIQNYPLLLAHT